MAPDKRGKRPRAGDVRPYPQKRPAIAPSFGRDAVMSRKLVWKFEHVDHDGPWSFDEMSGGEWLELLSKLQNLSP